MSIRERLARTPPGYRYSIGRILAIYSGLMVTLLLAALDQTIVSTALPRIVGDLGGLTQYSWVFTAYLLATTVTVPIYGKLGDVYGRRPLFIIAICIFLLGSALCGLAQGMTQLVVFRAIQGVGAGGLIPLALAVIGNLVPPRDRGRYQGLIGAVFASASIIGPAVGGFIVDNTSWRWIFYVNLPVGGVALLVIWITMPRRRDVRPRAIDWTGATVARARDDVAAAGARLGRAPVRVEFAAGARDARGRRGSARGVRLLGAACRRADSAVRHPAEPDRALEHPLHGSHRHGDVRDDRLRAAVRAGRDRHIGDVVGVVLTPLMLGAVTTSFLAGQWVSRTGHYRANVVVGPLILAVGMFLLWRMNVHTTNGEAARAMVVAGIGIGSVMQVFVLSVQNAVRREQMGSATALTQFARSIGATVGVTVIGVIVNQGLPKGLQGGAEVVAVHRLPPALRDDLANALRPAFLAATCVAVLVWVIAVVGVKEVPLRSGFEDAATEVAAIDASGAPR